MNSVIEMWFVKVAWLLVAIFLIAAFLAFYSEIPGIVESIEGATLSVLAWALLLSLANYGLRFLRWQRFVKRMSGTHIPVYQHLLVYIAGFSFTLTPGKVGELARGAWLKRYGVEMATTTSAFMSERVQDVAVMLAFATVMAPIVYTQITLYEGVGFVVVSLCLIHIGLSACKRAELLAKSSIIPLQGIFKAIAAIGELRQRDLLVGYGLGLLAWGAEGAALWLIANDLWQNSQMAMHTAFGVYGVSILTGAVSMIPGGLGTTELTLGVLLAQIGMPAAIAVAVVAVSRFVTLWFGIGVGFVALAILGKPDAVR